MALKEPEVKNIIKNRKISDVEQLAKLGSHIRELQRKKFTQTLIIVTAPLILASTIFAYMLSSYLVRPIEKLSTQIAHIQPWQLEKRIPQETSSKEIEMLTNKFNLLMNRLEKSFESQEEFIQDAAHELRTPISAILTNLQVLNSKKDKTKQDYINTLETIELLSKDLSRLNESLFILNRQNINQIDLSKFKLKELVEEVVENLDPVIKGNKADIKINIKDDIYLKGDQQMLGRAFKNVIENAVKYSPKGESISLVTEIKDKDLILRIKDNGPGIPQKDLPHIFKRFYRGENGQNLDQKGSGLGLAITKKIIEDHNGQIEIKSSNQGTEVLLTLPLSTEY
jgi:signal transduction histidine kinase